MDFHRPDKHDYPRLIEVWESAVRATHDFLPEPYLQRLKGLLLEQYLDTVLLFCTRNEQGLITGFAGVSPGKLQMLFVDAQYRGQGLGTQLLKHAIEQFNIRHLDVNEQNPQALGFYIKHGFKQISRSPVDGLDQPYPMLRLGLARHRRI
ncbi:GNAT family N-acetyltransferase [Pseudomonas sp. 3A(2025)]